MPETGTKPQSGERICLDCGHSANATRTANGFRILACACPGMTAADTAGAGPENKETAAAGLPEAGY